MGAAALAVVAHVPDPRRSGTVASVYDPHESCTLAFALAQTGVSLATVAESTGVSKTRAAQWACPDHEAEPHLGHVRRMPASVRRALGQQLHCGKPEGEECPACGGVNACVWADKKRHARDQAERAGAGVSPAPSLTERADGGKPGPDDREIQPGAE